MDGLGRVFNVVPTAEAVEIDMTDCEAVTFVCTTAEAFTLQEAQDGTGTGAQNLAVIDHYYDNAGSVGATTWSLEEQTAAATVTPTASAVFTVHASQLSDGFTHVLVNNTTAGTVIAITHDLSVQRSAENLPALTG